MQTQKGISPRTSCPHYGSRSSGGRRMAMRSFLKSWGLLGWVICPALFWLFHFCVRRVVPLETVWLWMPALNLGVPLAVSIAALFLCWKFERLPESSFELALPTILGIWVSAPTYFFFTSWSATVLSNAAGYLDHISGGFQGWLLMQCTFPLSTLSLLTYDGTLPAPFVLGIALFVLSFAQTLRPGERRNVEQI